MHADGGVAGTASGYLLSGLAPAFATFLPLTRLFFAEDNSLRTSDQPRRTDFVSASRRLFLLILASLVLQVGLVVSTDLADELLGAADGLGYTLCTG